MSQESHTTTTTRPTPGGTANLGAHQVSRIGYGAMQLPGPGIWGPPKDREAALAGLRRAIELGVNHIDTAAFYGDGVSNELIHAALHPYPDDLVLVSKIGAARDAKANWIAADRPAQLRAATEDNLRALEVDQVDVMNLRLHSPSGDESGTYQATDLDSQLAEMVALRDEGKIGAIGVSTVTFDQLKQAIPAGIVCVQNQYSLLDRSGEDILELCQENDIAWVPYFPLGSAFPQFPKVSEHPVVVEIATAMGATPAQVGLAWLLAHDPHTLLIPGTSSVQHLEDNLATSDVHLDAETMARLDAIGTV